MARGGRDESEFGGGPGFIDDAERRAARVVGQESGPFVSERIGEELAEIYATDPYDPEADPATSDIGGGKTGR